MGPLVDAIRPRYVFCGHMHRPAQTKAGVTQIVALDAFSDRPGGAVAILEEDPSNLLLADNKA